MNNHGGVISTEAISSHALRGIFHAGGEKSNWGRRLFNDRGKFGEIVTSLLLRPLGESVKERGTCAAPANVCSAIQASIQGVLHRSGHVVMALWLMQQD